MPHKRKSDSADNKLHVVEFAAENSNRAAKRGLGFLLPLFRRDTLDKESKGLSDVE